MLIILQYDSIFLKIIHFFLLDNQIINKYNIFFSHVYIFDIQNSCTFAARYSQ